MEDTMDYKQSSMVDIAFDYMKSLSGPVSFFDLWNKVAELKGYNEEERDQNQSLFYTGLILDGRMITTGENMWDLRLRRKFEEVHIDMNDIYNDDEEVEEEEVDDSVDEDSYDDDEN